MYGGWCSGAYHSSMMALQRLCIQVGLKAAFSDQWSEALVTRARNYEADKARASGMTHHMFVDADHAFSPGDILQLMMADKDIACAPYAKKNINWVQVADALKCGFPPEIMDEFACDMNLNTLGPVRMNGEPQRIQEGGNGLMMIKMSVYDRLQAAYPEIEYLPHKIDETPQYGDKKYFYAFFDTAIDPETRHYTSEDWTFCRRFSRIGGEIYMLPWLRTGHYGPYTFIANAPAIAELQKQMAERAKREAEQSSKIIAA
jgi:hypothetical protein